MTPICTLLLSKVLQEKPIVFQLMKRYPVHNILLYSFIRTHILTEAPDQKLCQLPVRWYYGCGKFAENCLLKFGRAPAITNVQNPVSLQPHDSIHI